MRTADSIRSELEAWIEQHWDPDLTAGDWWQQMAAARYGFPALPEPWGRGFDRDEARLVGDVLNARKVLGPPSGVGVSLALPTILAHGTPDQLERFVPRVLDGSEGWCQLFSEPNAGSDLASLQTRATRDGDEWIITGQKVWTSRGHVADFGILLARTAPELPKHQGITYFLFPMRQSGVDVRPLREMTGEALFNEVFLDDARVPDMFRLGEVNQGWRVANTTLTHERAGIGDNAGAISRAAPGSVAGHLQRRAGDFLDRPRKRSAGGGVGPGTVRRLLELARTRDSTSDPVIRQELADLHTKLEIIRMTAARIKAGGARSGGEGNLAKLRMTDLVREVRNAAGVIGGPHAQIDDDDLTGGFLSSFIVASPAPSIYGGTDEVQRNIIAERVLGLPKEPGPDRNTPFRDLLQDNFG